MKCHVSSKTLSACGIALLAVACGGGPTVESDAAPLSPDALAVDGSLPPPDAVVQCVSGDGQCPAGCNGSDLDCVVCDLTVPDDRATIDQAILDAPVPGTVCIRAGNYPEHVEMRYQVHLQGEGPQTVIDGNLDLRGLLTTDQAAVVTTIRDLTVSVAVGGAALGLCPENALLCGYRYGPGSTLALEIERVRMFSEVNPSVYTTYCVVLSAAGSLRLTIRDSECHADRGMRISGTIGTSVPTVFDILVERTRFESQIAADEINWPLQLLFGTTWNPMGFYEIAPLGSRVNVNIRNNEFYDSGVEAVYLTGAIVLEAEDEAQSGYDFLHNTFVVGRGLAIWNRITMGPALRFANNLYWGGGYTGSTAAVYESNIETTADPFVDVAGGDLRLVMGASAIDTANASYTVTDDFHRQPRPIDGNNDGVAEPDVGAHERFQIPQ